MIICAIICELNPFHNGHAYLIESVKRTGRYDGVLCIMSGHFTQRGDIALLDKFTRAKHAVLGGADCVIELPAPFAVSPAQIFASGAVKLISSIPDVKAIAFGCEEMTDFAAAAKAAAAEDGAFRQALREGLDGGESFAKSYSDALKKACGADISSPNNILALEYAKAVLKMRPDIKLEPVKRVGAGYRDEQLGGAYASASGIRAHLGEESAKRFLPPFSAKDLEGCAADCAAWDAIVKYALCRGAPDKVYGGGEGLANRLYELRGLHADEIVAAATTKRYPAARIRRALTANALQFTAKETDGFIKSAGYLKPLAVRSGREDMMLGALAKSSLPVVITGSDAAKLEGSDGILYKKTRFADEVWCAAKAKDVYDCTILKV